MTTSTSPIPRQIPLVIDHVKQQIRARIGREWQVGDRLPPIEELARSLGVGARNAYRAVRELADEGLLASRPHHGTFVTDRPHHSKIRLKDTRITRSRLIQLPLGPSSDGMIHRMAHACADELKRLGHEVRIVPSMPGMESHVIDLSKVDADGLVLMNTGPTRIILAPHQVLSLIDTSGIAPDNLSSRYDIVGPDNEQGGMLAGQLFTIFGLLDVAFIGMRGKAGDGYHVLDAMRLSGLQRGLGQVISPKRRFYVDNYSEFDGAQFAVQYKAMTDRPKALFFVTDDIATGFVVGGYAIGLTRRDDYMMIGFDGQSRGRLAMSHGFTTVAVPAEAMGRQAAIHLDSRFDQPDLPPRRLALGCSVQHGKTTPLPRPGQPFFGESLYWPAPPPPEPTETSQTPIPKEQGA